MKEGVMIYVLLILVLFAAIAELTVWLTYRDKINEYAAVCSQIEAAEAELRNINKTVPVFLTSDELDAIRKHTDLAFEHYLFSVAGNDPERNDIRKAQHYAVNTFTQLAARRREEIKQ